MTDIEITRLCAEAMGMGIGSLLAEYRGGPLVLRAIPEGKTYEVPYDPLHDDAQAMALVKKFCLLIQPPLQGVDSYWTVTDGGEKASDMNLNRAICGAVAKMQKARD